MKTIAQQLNIKEFPFEIKDKNGQQIYWEDSYGHWYKYEYDTNGNNIYAEWNDGIWMKREYDLNGKEIYFENSSGVVSDNRPKEEHCPCTDECLGYTTKECKGIEEGKGIIGKQCWKAFAKGFGPKIIDLSDVEGVEMEVSTLRSLWITTKIVAHRDNKIYIDESGYIWKYARPVEKAKQYTMEELEKIVGHKFEIK